VSTGRIAPEVLWSLSGLFGILVAATVVYLFLRKIRPGTDDTEIGLRILSWWVMVAIFTPAMVLSRNVSLFFFAFISFLALKE
jgi:phosphatidate cytidylyltransferase